MINVSGVMAVLDHHITINWDDGPTLLRISGLVRYHTSDSLAPQTLRVTASRRSSEEPLCFYSANADLHATWTVQEYGAGWTFQLSVTNENEVDDDDGTQIYLDALEVIRMDSALGGVFSLGAPAGLWQCSGEFLMLGTAVASDPVVEPGDTIQSLPVVNGFIRQREMIVQPSTSNRSSPPALLIRALQAEALSTELQLKLDGDKFEQFTAQHQLDGTLIGVGVTIASPEFWVVAGDDVEELKRLEAGI